jgi:hypothetical protein
MPHSLLVLTLAACAVCAQASSPSYANARSCTCAISGKNLAELEAAYDALVAMRIEKAAQKHKRGDSSSNSRSKQQLEGARREKEAAQQKVRALQSQLHDQASDKASLAKANAKLSGAASSTEAKLADTEAELATLRKAYDAKAQDVKQFGKRVRDLCTCEANLLTAVDAALYTGGSGASGRVLRIASSVVLGLGAIVSISAGAVRARARAAGCSPALLCDICISCTYVPSELTPTRPRRRAVRRAHRRTSHIPLPHTRSRIAGVVRRGPQAANGECCTTTARQPGVPNALSDGQWAWR